MILKRGRFIVTAAGVFVAALLVGLGEILTESPRVTSQAAQRSGAAPRSGDDGGFSVVLAKPREPYLVGQQKIAIDPTVPAGDAIAQVDFFVDGKLVHTDMESPYVSEYDFGGEILRHTIVVTALTGGGRRAKVSLVSRSAGLSDSASRPIASVPAVVRDAAGRIVEGLSVSDFALLEDGAPQPIVHFDGDPAPASVAVAIHTSSSAAAWRSTLLRGAASFAASLPSYQSLALIDAARPGAVAEFSFDHEAFAQRLGEGAAGHVPSPDPPLAPSLEAAATALESRPRGRTMLILVAGCPAAAAEQPEKSAPNDGGSSARGSGVRSAALPPGPLTLLAALDRLMKSGVTLHAVVLGDPGVEGEPCESLRQAADETGGEFVPATSPQQVESACRRISESLLRQYLISYSPDPSRLPGWRSIEVRVRRPDVQVRTRRGFFAE